LSEFVVPSELPDLSSITFAFSINGTLRQQGDSAFMLNPIPTLLTHIAQANRLVPGDLILPVRQRVSAPCNVATISP